MSVLNISAHKVLSIRVGPIASHDARETGKFWSRALVIETSNGEQTIQLFSHGGADQLHVDDRDMPREAAK